MMEEMSSKLAVAVNEAGELRQEVDRLQKQLKEKSTELEIQKTSHQVILEFKYC
jgi:nitrate/nitrite-specific signal transduction histidine kinase